MIALMDWAAAHEAVDAAKRTANILARHWEQFLLRTVRSTVAVASAGEDSAVPMTANKW